MGARDGCVEFYEVAPVVRYQGPVRSNRMRKDRWIGYPLVGMSGFEGCDDIVSERPQCLDDW